MNIRIELDDGLDEIEVVIRAGQLSAELEQIQQALSQVNRPQLIFYKGNSEYFLDLADILFFETDGSRVFGHSRDNAYEVKLKLYELEDCLPPHFVGFQSTVLSIRGLSTRWKNPFQAPAPSAFMIRSSKSMCPVTIINY